MPKIKGLSNKQLAFCHEYLVDLNGTKAAIRAEYSAHTAGIKSSQLLNKPEIKKHIQHLITKRSERTDVNADFVIDNLVELVNISMARERVTVTVEGKDVSRLVFKDTGATKSLELLGRHLGIFNDKIQHSGGVIFMTDYGPDAND